MVVSRYLLIVSNIIIGCKALQQISTLVNSLIFFENFIQFHFLVSYTMSQQPSYFKKTVITGILFMFYILIFTGSFFLMFLIHLSFYGPVHHSGYLLVIR